MKILRSKGQSYTQSGVDPEKLGRGLKPFDQAVSHHKVEPSSLREYIVTEPDLAMRQLVSALDKVVRKRPLRSFNVTAYADRVTIASYLWVLLKPQLPTQIRDIDQTKATWQSRVHSSYATSDVDEVSPKSDKNAKVIEKYAAKAQKDFDDGVPGAKQVATRDSLCGMWHAALWCNSHRETAKAIFDHVFKQEMLIRGTAEDGLPAFRKAKEKDKASGQGLAAARAQSMAQSTHDPRLKQEDAKKKKHDWSKQHEKIYYKKLVITEEGSRQVDVAERVIIALKNDLERNAANLGSIIGKAIFTHFGKLKGTYEDVKDGSTVLHLMNLNNAVRTFYADLAETQRLRIAFDPKLRERHSEGRLTDRGNSAEAGDSFSRLLPSNAAALQKVMGAVDGNRDISRWIRLGRLVVHATDTEVRNSFDQTEFERRLAYFATSDGQSHIKRNETFARVWRGASAMSLRTLKAWADPNNKAVIEPTRQSDVDNRDIAATGVARKAKDNLTIEHFNAFNEVVFGGKKIGNLSRADIFAETPATKGQAQRDMWAFLRLGADMRDAISHLITKPRLARLLRDGIVDAPVPAAEGKKAPIGDVSVETDQKLSKLLVFDKDLRRHMIAKEIDRLQIAQFASPDQLNEFINQFAELPSGEPITVPRFMSVLARVNALGKHVEKQVTKAKDGKAVSFENTLSGELKGLATVKVDLETQTRQGPESCKLGSLRHLYETGFRNWLSDQGNNAAVVKETLASLVDSKAKRVSIHQTEKQLYFTPDDSMLQTLLNEGYDTLPELFAELDARSTQLQRSFNRFKSDSKAQKEKSGWVDDFKQELFAHLFARYIRDTHFEWLYGISTPVHGVTLKDQDPDAIKVPELPYKSWHARFHAWLYLLPLAEVSKLRHQMIKSRVLEIKGSEPSNKEEQETLAHAEMLMALHLAIRDAGYAGEEHKALLDLQPKDKNGTDVYTLLFGGPEQFEKLMSTDRDDQPFSLSGTRRGLREMMRFGNASILGSIFKHHTLGPEETSLFEDKALRDAGGVPAMLRDDLKKELVTACQEWTPKAAEADQHLSPAMRNLAEQYQSAATQAAMHAFTARAARLGDHIAVHDLMMRISARLADYAWLWERDRAYIYLGMLWDNMGGKLEVMVPSNAEAEPFQVAVKAKDDKPFVLWGAKGGFATDKSREFDLMNLATDHQAIFRHHFIEREEHPKDRARVNALQKDSKTFHEPRVGLGPVRIRNDLAHFNFLSFANPKDDRQSNNDSAIKGTPNFNYLVNAARSLVSHDRKLKNAVAKSIADIIEEAGIEITWTLEHDRLRKSRVSPRLMSHLEFLPREFDAYRFSLPRVSARYASMVKALFDHDRGGNRERVGEDQKGTLVYAARGLLTYPAFPTESRVPSDFVEWRAYDGGKKS